VAPGLAIHDYHTEVVGSFDVAAFAEHLLEERTLVFELPSLDVAAAALDPNAKPPPPVSP
jgi:hypothetical protein